MSKNLARLLLPDKYYVSVRALTLAAMGVQTQSPPNRIPPASSGHSKNIFEGRRNVSHGLVGARVKAIEGNLKNAGLCSPQNNDNGRDFSAPTKPRNSGIRSLKSSSYFQKFIQQPETQASTSYSRDRSAESPLSSYGRRHRSPSTLHSPLPLLPSGLRPSYDRKSHSASDLHFLYSGSPHGMKKYRDYSNLRR